MSTDYLKRILNSKVYDVAIESPLELAPLLSQRIQNSVYFKREDTQPVHTRTGGSTFANPPGHQAWQLIDRAGCRGLVRGGAMVSEKHTNFLINTGNATAADLEALGEEVRRRVQECSGVMLEWEIRRIGDALTPVAAEMA